MEDKETREKCTGTTSLQPCKQVSVFQIPKKKFWTGQLYSNETEEVIFFKMHSVIPGCAI